MRVLVAFLLSVLGCSLAEEKLQSHPKCDLKKKFENHTDRAQLRPLDLNFMAKIICYVERKSGFNTSLVTHETEDRSSERRHAKDGGTVWPHSLTTRSAKKSPRSSRPRHQDEEVPKFYGLFQLSNLLECSDGTTPSPKICSMDCDKFIDDDIGDDIECLLMVHFDLMKNVIMGPHCKKLQQWYKRIFQECRNITSDYLDECVP